MLVHPAGLATAANALVQAIRSRTPVSAAEGSTRSTASIDWVFQDASLEGVLMPTDGPVPGSSAPQQWTPISGVIYRQDYGFTVAHMSITVTINPTALLGASVVAEVSADEGAHWFAWANVGVPAGLTLASANQQIVLLVQSNWLWRVTATRATIGTAMMIGMY